MGDNTGISWTDATWNPVTGCDKVSPGCDHCYAETIAHRFAGSKAYPDGFKLMLRPERLEQPLRWRRPRRIFVNSMSDLFHNQVPDDYLRQVFEVMAMSPRHQFQVLTKRAGRMRSFIKQLENEVVRKRAGHPKIFTPDKWPLANVWLGVSAEDQHWADVRIPVLLDTPAAVRFVSAEPLLGPIDLADAVSRWTPPHEHPAWGPGQRITNKHGLVEVQSRLHTRNVLHWVIVGGESGPGARPMDPAWARGLRDDCQRAQIAFFMKQAGSVLAREWGCKGKGIDPAQWPEHFPQEYPAA